MTIRRLSHRPIVLCWRLSDFYFDQACLQMIKKTLTLIKTKRNHYANAALRSKVVTEDIRSLGSCVKSFRAVICRPNQPFIASCIMATLGASTSDTMKWNPFWRSIIYASLLSRLLMWNSNSNCIGLYFNLIHFCAKSWANKWSLHYLHGYSMYEGMTIG